MIILINVNGSFGVEKTTVAKLLVDRVSKSTLFNPEIIGFMLRRLPSIILGGCNTEDYQDIPLWRRLTVLTALMFHKISGRTIIIPMTFCKLEYLNQIRSQLLHSRVAVHHFCLILSVDNKRRKTMCESYTATAAKRCLETSPLDVPIAILQRRSIRQFNSDAIAPELLKQLIELTVAAPTSWNLQDWYAVVVQSDEQKRRLSEAAFGQKQPIEAAMTFVFVADPNVAFERDLNPIFEQAKANGAWSDEFIEYFKGQMIPFQTALKKNGLLREYAVKDAMIAATHLMLAAESLGLSTSIMNGWLEDKVKAVIGITGKSDLAIAVLVAVGYGAESVKNPGRLPLNQRVFVDSMGNPYTK